MARFRLLIGTTLTFLLIMIVNTPALATIYGFDFEPKAGGPGTLVHAYGTVPPIEVTIELGIAHDINAVYPDNPINQFEPIAVLRKIQAMADQPSGAEAGLNTTVVIPSHKFDGSPITERNLAIRVVDKDGNQIFQTPARVFNFMPGPLPVTGSNHTFDAPIAIATSLILIVAGLLIKRRQSAVQLQK